MEYVIISVKHTESQANQYEKRIVFYRDKCRGYTHSFASAGRYDAMAATRELLESSKRSLIVVPAEDVVDWVCSDMVAKAALPNLRELAVAPEDLEDTKPETESAPPNSGIEYYCPKCDSTNVGVRKAPAASIRRPMNEQSNPHYTRIVGSTDLTAGMLITVPKMEAYCRHCGHTMPLGKAGEG